MGKALAPAAEVFLDERQKSALRRLHQHPAASSSLALVDSEGNTQLLDDGLSSLIFRTLHALQENGAVEVRSMPKELTSSTAARLLGVSRPTLLKKAQAGEIASFKVGTHTRFRREDVLEFARQEEHRRRDVLDEILSLGDQIGDAG